jgi:hypothetical protein
LAVIFLYLQRRLAQPVNSPFGHALDFDVKNLPLRPAYATILAVLRAILRDRAGPGPFQTIASRSI